MLRASKFLAGNMSLGKLMQAAAALLQLQLSLNWAADKALCIKNWLALARRLAALELATNVQSTEPKNESFP